MEIFITGGAGFIGANCADHFLARGDTVIIFDNFSRIGSQANVQWLLDQHGSKRLQVIKGDVRNYEALKDAVVGAGAVIHLAGQVAVTVSVQEPREDFEINALGTFNVLEAVRHHCPDAAFLYASTNKVYGSLAGVRIKELETRYSYVDYPAGIPESFPLDFHSPYGCSKGAGDQYTQDYARIYGLRTVTFRQSCIYGQRQFGVEDQGWLAHFIIAAVMNQPIRIYGDGKQVRDLLHVSDLIRAYALSIENMDKVHGEVLNLGGGPNNTSSIWVEFRPLLESLTGRPIPISQDDWRPGDQQVFIANIKKAADLLHWQPTISPAKGITDLYHWVTANRQLF